MGHNRLRYCPTSCDVTEEFPFLVTKFRRTMTDELN